MQLTCSRGGEPVQTLSTDPDMASREIAAGESATKDLLQHQVNYFMGGEYQPFNIDTSNNVIRRILGEVGLPYHVDPDFISVGI